MYEALPRQKPEDDPAWKAFSNYSNEIDMNAIANFLTKNYHSTSMDSSIASQKIGKLLSKLKNKGLDS